MAADADDHTPADPTADRDAVAVLQQRAGARLDLSLAELVGDLADAVYRRAPSDAVRRALEHPDRTVDWLVRAVRIIDERDPGQLVLEVRDDEAGTLVELACEDTPFLVSTVLEEVQRPGERVAQMLHPVLGVERDARGRLAGLRPAREAALRESYIWLQLARRLDADERDDLRARLSRVLGDARAATADFQAMTARADAAASALAERGPQRWPPDEVEEVCALIEWLVADHFVWLGARDYHFVPTDQGPAVVVDADSGLGILRDASTSSFAEPVPVDRLPPAVGLGLVADRPMTVSRTNRPSTVHKQLRMISLGITELDADGEPAVEHRFLGLFAQRAYAQPASTIPLLRRKLEHVLVAEDVVANSHDERALRMLFEAFPKHQLFALDAEALRASIVDLLEAQRRGQVRLWCQAEPGGRGVVAVLTIPRERFNARLRHRVQQYLASQFGAEEVDYHLSMAEGDAALLHFVLHVDPRALESVDLEEMERRVIDMARTWDDALGAELRRREPDEARADLLAGRYQGAFDDVYQAATTPAEACADILALEAVRTGPQPVTLRLVATGGERTPLRARVVKRGAEMELSEFVPILESLGLVVVEQVPHRLQVEGVALQLHDFGVRLEPGRQLDVRTDHERLADAVAAIWHGAAEADLLNRLVLDAAMTWRDVAVLRAYRRYRRQVGTAYTEAYQDEAIVAHPRVARALVELFRVRCDPRVDGGDAQLAAARTELAEALEQVAHLDQDRILRRIAGTVEATVRSNVAVEPDGQRGSDALALKLRSADVPELTAPVPYAETFVSHTSMEGVHLRGGPVARGGIRASDRREDFRTEVLGLMKAQVPKNAVIVPTGAKGGFVLRDVPEDPAARREAVATAYRRYVRALLDVSDDVADGETVPPAQVRRRDDDDPYLVVAPDKGTATLSDEANRIAESYGFWLGDAFASGGSSGYDHKALAVTARGAWVAVQRHFRELGVDVQHEPVRVVGIGDMGGDVFGNGLLRSRSVKLVGAFDHRDVFLDPDPDPERSFAERTRLFESAESAWPHYDPDVISDGGGVWSRRAKTVPLSDAARALLDVDDAALSPPAVIRALLCAPVDLLFLGGIGTFVKASVESHDDVGDRANDGVRVDAGDVRARVIGEGANLGLTQRARIEYARRGGRCNTDAVDNAAGVGTSDREVNVKLALATALRTGEIAHSQRDALLTEMTDDVVAGVLADVDRQAGAISHELDASAQDLTAHGELLRRLEHHGDDPAPAGRLDRELEVLPGDAELARRAEAGAGLTRPEIAVLLGYAKLDLRDVLVASPLPDDVALESLLTDYFPSTAARTVPKALAAHPLRRELVATRAANDVMDHMGATWVDRVARQTACEPHEVVAAYWVARAVLDAPGAWAVVTANELRSDPLLVAELRGLVDDAVDTAARTVLRLGVTGVGEAVDDVLPAARALAGGAGELGSERHRRRRREQIARYTDLGLSPEDAERLVGLADLAVSPSVATLARQLGRAPRSVAEVYLRVGDALPFARLAGRLDQVTPRGLWERWQCQGLIDELRQTHEAISRRVLAEHPERDAPGAVAAFLDTRPQERERVDGLVRRVESAEPVELNAVAVAARALRDAFGG